MRTCAWLDSAINYSGCVRQLEDNESHTTINYSPNGKLLAYGGLKGNYRIIDTSNYSVFDSAIGRSYAVKKVAFSPGGNLLVESDSQGVVGFFKIEGKIVYLSNDIEIPLEKETTQHLDFALSPDGSLIATASENTSVKIWNIKNRSLQREFPSNGSVVAFSPDGTLVAAETPDTNIALWRVADGTLLRTLTSNSKYRASVLAFSPDGSVLVAGNNSLNIWRVSDGILLRTLSDFENGINGLAFSPAGNRLVTSTMPYYEDNDDSDYLTVWDPNTGQQLKRWKDSGAATYGLAFSPDGKTLAAAGIDAVRVWRIT
ncbi:MAG TPA: hypothetical protein VH186_18820 [Chloroflexia bacterium]|nr:hypothetical protein [Chloroflexia bacterium]